MKTLQAPSGLILASGMSRRFGNENKLLARLHGEEIVRHTARAYLEARLEPVIVVAGYQFEAVREALTGLAVSLVENPEYEEGQSRSLVRGIAALSADTQAAVVGVGDQPRLTSAVIEALIARYHACWAPLVVPRYGGRRGNPVLFDRTLFGELMRVVGDHGGRDVVLRHREAISWLDVADELAGSDVDTDADLQRLQVRDDL